MIFGRTEFPSHVVGLRASVILQLLLELLSVLCHMGLSSTTSCFIKASKSIKQEIECREGEREEMYTLEQMSKGRAIKIAIFLQIFVRVMGLPSGSRQ